MTDLITENARLRAALDEREADMLEWLHKISHPTAAQSPQAMARKYAERLRREMAERAALATPAPDAVQEAARVLLADGVAMQTLVDFQLRHSATASAKARSMRHVQMKAALRAIAGDRT